MFLTYDMKLDIKTNQKEEFIDITSQIKDFLQKQDQDSGIIHIHCLHTTAGLTINENADPSVKKDILNSLDKIIPQNDSYQHAEGNSPAHIKSSLMGPSLSIPFENKSLSLGTWQGIYFCEFDGPRKRKVKLKVT